MSNLNREFLLNRMGYMLDRPNMYASSPEALEDLLIFIDELLYENAHSDYYDSHDFGSASYCSRMRMNNPLTTRDELWTGLVETWRDYLRRRDPPIEYLPNPDFCSEK